MIEREGIVLVYTLRSPFIQISGYTSCHHFGLELVVNITVMCLYDMIFWVRHINYNNRPQTLCHAFNQCRIESQRIGHSLPYLYCMFYGLLEGTSICSLTITLASSFLYCNNGRTLLIGISYGITFWNTETGE